MGQIIIDREKCHRDGSCTKVCPGNLLEFDQDGYPAFRPGARRRCIACGHCVAVCQHDALENHGITAKDLTLIDPALNISPEMATQFLKSRRSIRDFQKQEVPEEVIKAILDSTRWAPSAANRQPVSWLILHNPEEVKKIGSLVVEWLRHAEGPGARYASFADSWDKGKDLILRGAPHLVLAHSLGNLAWNVTDCTIALTYFELAASAYGVGTCLAGILMMAAAHPPLLEALKLPKGHNLYGGLMLGYPEFSYHRLPHRNDLKIEWRK